MKLTTLLLLFLFSTTIKGQSNLCDSVRMLVIPVPNDYQDVSSKALHRLKLLEHCNLDSLEIEHLEFTPLYNFMAFDFYKEFPDSTLTFGSFLDYYLPHIETIDHQFAIGVFAFESKWGNKIADVEDLDEIVIDLKNIGLLQNDIDSIKKLIVTNSSKTITYKELVF